MPERRIQRHGTRLSVAHEAAADVQFPAGSRVITPEGFTGRVLFVDDSFNPGNTAYQVTLDSGMGGGTYLGSQLRPAPAGLRGNPGFSNLPAGVTASLDEVEASEVHLASDDYPEMGSILHDRPDPATQIKIIGSRRTALFPHEVSDEELPEHMERDHDQQVNVLVEHERSGTMAPGTVRQLHDLQHSHPVRDPHNREDDWITAGGTSTNPAFVAQLQKTADDDNFGRSEPSGTWVNGVQIDGHGDAPQHGLIPRAADPNDYDYESTEGALDPAENEDPWMKDRDQPASAGNPGPDSVGGASAGAAPNGGPGPGGGSVASLHVAALHGDDLIEHMIHYHAVYPDEVKNEEALQYAHEHQHKHMGMDEWRTQTTLPLHTHHDLLQPWEEKYPAPQLAESMPRPGNGWGDYRPEHNEVATPHQHQWPEDRGLGPLSHTLSSLHEARVPWTGPEREKLHEYPYPTATWGDFVSRSEFRDPKQHAQHADNVLADEVRELESEDLTGGSLAGRAEAVRVRKAAGMRKAAAMSEEEAQHHLANEHGWTNENFRRTFARGDRFSDMHDSLHDARLANHNDHDDPAMEQARHRNFMHHRQLTEMFGTPARANEHLPLSHYSSREDDLYRHMHFAHGYSHGHLRQLLADEGHEGMELSHSVGHSADPRDNHTVDNIYSSIPHPQSFPELNREEEHAATERYGPSLGKPGFGFIPHPPQQWEISYANSGKGGRTPDNQERREVGLGMSVPAQAGDPNSLPLSHFSSLDPSPRAYLESVLAKKFKLDELGQEPGDRNVTDEVYKQLSKDYPPEAISWVHDVDWSGPEEIPLDQMDWKDLHNWTAWQEPEKVAKKRKKIEKNLGKGKAPKPLISVARPGRGDVMVADGHHRALGYAELGQPAIGYVAHPVEDEGPWDEMHAKQFTEQETGDPDAADQGQDIAPGEEGNHAEDEADLEQAGDKMLGEEKGKPGDKQDGKLSSGEGDPMQQPVFAGPPLTQSSTQGHKDHIPAMQQWEQASSGGGGEGDGDESGGDEGSGSKDKKKSKEAALFAFEAAADSPSFAFHFTAAWRDVVAKAKRIRSNGGVRITASTGGLVIGQVRGDHDVYESGIQRVAGKPRSIQHWACGCPWASWHQDKSYPGHLNGRPCSHVWALQLEATARMSSSESPGYTRTDPDIPGRPYEVVVKSLGPWTNGGWSKVWTAPTTLAPLREAAGALIRTGMKRDDVEALIIMTADQANAPWGGQSVPQEQPQPTYGATEPRNPDENPADAGWANAPDPDNWGSIDDGNIAQMPMSTAGARKTFWDHRMPEIRAWHQRTAPSERTLARMHRTGGPYEDGYAYIGDGGMWCPECKRGRERLGEDTSDMEPISWHELSRYAPAEGTHCEDCTDELTGPRRHTAHECENPSECQSALADLREEAKGVRGGPDERDAHMDYDHERMRWAENGMEEDHSALPHLKHESDPEEDWNAELMEHHEWSRKLKQRRQDEQAASHQINQMFRQHPGHEFFAQASADDVMVSPTAISPAPRADSGMAQFHEDQGTFPYVSHDNTAGPATPMNSRDPNGIRFEESLGDSPLFAEPPKDEFSWQPLPYAERPRSVPELMEHTRHMHGVNYREGDKEPSARFLHTLHERFHSGELHNKMEPHQHDQPEGHHDPVFGALQRALAELGMGDPRDHLPAWHEFDIPESWAHDDEAVARTHQRLHRLENLPHHEHDREGNIIPPGPMLLAQHEDAQRSIDEARRRIEEGERHVNVSDAFRYEPHEGPIDPVFGAKRHNWVTPEGGKPDGHSRSKTCADCGISAERYGQQAGSYWGYRMPHGGHEAFPRSAPPCGPEAHQFLYPELGSAAEGNAFLEDIERQNAQPDFKRDALLRALADISQEAPQLEGALAEMHDKPEGALDADGLTAGEPAPLDTAALGEFGASLRERMRARFGFNPVTHNVDPAGENPLDPMTTGGGPGMSQHDQDLTPNEYSIQTMGQQQWSGGGADSDEVDVPAGESSGSEAQIVASFQASAAAKQFGSGGSGGSASNSDIAARAREFLKTGVLSDGEASELIAEGKGTRARNLDLLDLNGTHYEAEAAAMKNRGLDLDDFDEDLVLI